MAARGVLKNGPVSVHKEGKIANSLNRFSLTHFKRTGGIPCTLSYSSIVARLPWEYADVNMPGRRF